MNRKWKLLLAFLIGMLILFVFGCEQEDDIYDQPICEENIRKEIYTSYGIVYAIDAELLPNTRGCVRYIPTCYPDQVWSVCGVTEGIKDYNPE